MRLRLFTKATIAAALVFGFAIAPPIKAQLHEAPEKLAFDAASVRVDDAWLGPPQRPATPHESGGPGTSDPGRITYSHQFLFVMIMRAWDLKSGDQLVGPSWLYEVPGNSYTLTATMPTTTTPDQFRNMLQNLLEDRFHLVVHHENRNFAGYDLVIAKDGSKLKDWTPNADLPRAVTKPGGLVPGQPGTEMTPMSMSSAMIHFTSRGPMAELVTRLPGFISMSNTMLQEPGVEPDPSVRRFVRVADKTGLTGTYDIELDFEGRLMRGSIPNAGGPTLFTALEKELGLKLVKAKDIPEDVLVIDHLDKVPTAN